MITIRRGTKHDVAWLFACCEDFARFYGSKISLAGNPEYGKQFLLTLVEQHLVYVGLKDNVPAGFIAGFVTPHHFNPNIRQLAELLWWVPEEFRNSGVGMKLFDAFMEYGKTNCDWITFTLEHNSPINDTFLVKRGFAMTEKTYLLECE